MIQALNSRKIRTEKGGYLFKAASDEENLYLGIIPCISDGERTHHYDIRMPGNLEYVLTGGIIPEGKITVLFIPADRNLTDMMRRGYRSIYVDLAAGLIAAGFSAPGEIDEVSMAMLEKAELFPSVPLTLQEIADQDKSTPRKS